MLAHQGAIDETLSVVLLFGALWVGWVGWSRLKGKGFPRMPAWAGPGLLAAAAALAVTAAIAPRAIFPPSPATSTGASASDPGPRPSSAAALGFAAPTDGLTVIGDEVEVILDLQGSHRRGHEHRPRPRHRPRAPRARRGARLDDLRARASGRPAQRAARVTYPAGGVRGRRPRPFDPRVTAVVRFETEGP